MSVVNSCPSFECYFRPASTWQDGGRHGVCIHSSNVGTLQICHAMLPLKPFAQRHHHSCGDHGLLLCCSEQYPSMHSRSAFFKHLKGVLQNNTHGAHGNFQLCPLPIANINFEISSFRIHSILCLSTSLISLRTMSRKELNDCRHSCDWAKVEEMELMDTWAREGWRNLKNNVRQPQSLLRFSSHTEVWSFMAIIENEFETFRTVIPSYHPNHPNPSIYCTSLSLVSLSTVKTGPRHGTASTFTACCRRRSISGHCAVAAMPKGGSHEWEENIPGTSKHTNKTGDSIHQIQSLYKWPVSVRWHAEMQTFWETF